MRPRIERECDKDEFLLEVGYGETIAEMYGELIICALTEETNGWSASRKLLEMDRVQAAERKILASQRYGCVRMRSFYQLIIVSKISNESTNKCSSDYGEGQVLKQVAAIEMLVLQPPTTIRACTSPRCLFKF